MSEPILKTEKLTKLYNEEKAVDEVSICINKGEIYGLAGLNGSGKTTLIRLIAKLIMPTSGGFSVIKNPDGSFIKIGAIVETPAIYRNLSGIENLEMQCGIACVDDKTLPKRLLEMVGLNPKSRKLAKNYSLGMRQRLGIAMTLVHSPQLLLLDEPTNGLDPAGIHEMRLLLQKLNKENGITILVSSHILSELEKLATRFGFLQEGRLIKEASLAEITSSLKIKRLLKVSNIEKASKAFEGIVPFTIENDTLIVDDKYSITELVAVLNKHNVILENLTTEAESFESYFIKLTEEYKNAKA